MNSALPVTTRFATAQDAAVVHAMLLQLASSIGVPEKVTSSSRDIQAAMADADPLIQAIIAEDAQRPIGLAIFFLTYSTWRGTRGVYLQDIYVAKHAQTAGLGTRLLREVAAWAADRGADHLRLSVDQGNSGAQAFYESLGFTYREYEKIYTIVGKAFVDFGAKS